MLKRTWCVLLVITLFAAPGAAFAAAPDRDAADRRTTVLERVLDGVLQLLDLDGDAARERTRETGPPPRSISAGDDAGGGIDPDG